MSTVPTTPAEPVGFVHSLPIDSAAALQREECGYFTIPVYASPPQPVPVQQALTDERIDAIQRGWIAKGMSGSRSFARAIEAELASQVSEPEWRESEARQHLEIAVSVIENIYPMTIDTQLVLDEIREFLAAPPQADVPKEGS